MADEKEVVNSTNICLAGDKIPDGETKIEEPINVKQDLIINENGSTKMELKVNNDTEKIRDTTCDNPENVIKVNNDTEKIKDTTCDNPENVNNTISNTSDTSNSDNKLAFTEVQDINCKKQDVKEEIENIVPNEAIKDSSKELETGDTIDAGKLNNLNARKELKIEDKVEKNTIMESGIKKDVVTFDNSNDAFETQIVAENVESVVHNDYKQDDVDKPKGLANGTDDINELTTCKKLEIKHAENVKVDKEDIVVHNNNSEICEKQIGDKGILDVEDNEKVCDRVSSDKNGTLSKTLSPCNIDEESYVLKHQNSAMEQVNTLKELENEMGKNSIIEVGIKRGVVTLGSNNDAFEKQIVAEEIENVDSAKKDKMLKNIEKVCIEQEQTDLGKSNVISNESKNATESVEFIWDTEEENKVEVDTKQDFVVHKSEVCEKQFGGKEADENLIIKEYLGKSDVIANERKNATESVEFIWDTEEENKVEVDTKQDFVVHKSEVGEKQFGEKEADGNLILEECNESEIDVSSDECNNTDDDLLIVDDECEEDEDEPNVELVKEEEPVEVKPLDHDEDFRNPQYIPKRGAFYEHDNRTCDPIEETEEDKELEENLKGSPKSDKKWAHDLYDPDEQGPKTNAELFAQYGYNIREEECAPKSRRWRRYGRGPTKYTRNWQDKTAYGRPVQNTRNNNATNHRNNRNFNDHFPIVGEKTSLRGRGRGRGRGSGMEYSHSTRSSSAYKTNVKNQSFDSYKSVPSVPRPECYVMGERAEFRSYSKDREPSSFIPKDTGRIISKEEIYDERKSTIADIKKFLSHNVERAPPLKSTLRDTKKNITSSGSHPVQRSVKFKEPDDAKLDSDVKICSSSIINDLPSTPLTCYSSAVNDWLSTCDMPVAYNLTPARDPPSSYDTSLVFNSPLVHDPSSICNSPSTHDLFDDEQTTFKTSLHHLSSCLDSSTAKIDSPLPTSTAQASATHSYNVPLQPFEPEFTDLYPKRSECNPPSYIPFDVSTIQSQPSHTPTPVISDTANKLLTSRGRGTRQVVNINVEARNAARNALFGRGTGRRPRRPQGSTLNSVRTRFITPSESVQAAPIGRGRIHPHGIIPEHASSFGICGAAVPRNYNMERHVECDSDDETASDIDKMEKAGQRSIRYSHQTNFSIHELGKSWIDNKPVDVGTGSISGQQADVASLHHSHPYTYIVDSSQAADLTFNQAPQSTYMQSSTDHLMSQYPYAQSQLQSQLHSLPSLSQPPPHIAPLLSQQPSMMVPQSIPPMVSPGYGYFFNAGPALHRNRAEGFDNQNASSAQPLQILSYMSPAPIIPPTNLSHPSSQPPPSQTAAYSTPIMAYNHPSQAPAEFNNERYITPMPAPLQQMSHQQHEVYQSRYGVTYYNTQSQKQSRDPPPPRTKAAIPIVPPPSNDGIE